MPHTVFNLADAAEYLHISRDDLNELVRRNEVPCERKGGQIVFRRAAIDQWASQRILGFAADDLQRYHRRSSARYHDLSQHHAIIPELMTPDCVEPAMAAKTKASVIRAMVDLAERTGKLVYREDLLKSLLDREQLGTTALAGGLAMLHPLNHDPYLFDDSFIAVARSVQSIPFGSPDGRTTNVFFLICCQDDRIHLHVLARLSMLCYHTDVLLRLREAADGPAMLAVLVAAEEELLQRRA